MGWFTDRKQLRALEAENTQLRQENDRLRQDKAQLQAQVAGLESEKARLQAELAAAKKHSGNSSKPPLFAASDKGGYPKV